MESLSPQVVSAAKLPILNPNEFDLWKMRIEQYFLMTYYSLWEVILTGDSLVPIRVIKGVVQPVAPTTTEQSLKIYEAEVKSSSSAGTTTQNIAFMPSSNTLGRSKSVMDWLYDFEELNGGYVAFGGNPKGASIPKLTVVRYKGLITNITQHTGRLTVASQGGEWVDELVDE
nr:hypothetical protein [Tanacetum cinerariifolium]